ncbi:tyrosine-type recombinase/integrase [Methylocaldum sp.]|uniref:tyrosine-type recombinase/integrase n=1 Tax=Methylocaldum sp. TaxID=1969727 RepID=UPI002D53737B|nr:integrase arm-type DNA-binding domain-containing protein [Methylocaldum sp.]HYE37517.1 integrase arm-type DNA-binding domain-containing protein [Methylocaldum sp.]
MPLSDTAVRNAKAKDKPYKLADEKGLYLLVKPAGKYWRFDYRFERKRKTLAFGAYPDVSLKEARGKRDEARRRIAQGVDPGVEKKAIKTAESETFEAIAREWFIKFAPNWAESHSDKIIRRLERDIFPWLGKRLIREITAPELLAVLRRIEGRALETAHRVLQNCGQIFRYAIATGRADRDISADLKGALPPAKLGHFAAVTDPRKVGELLRAIDAFEGTFPVKCALRLAPLVFVRPGELRAAEWAHIDLDAAEWSYTVTKTKTPHIVPLATQAVEILRELHPLTGHGRFVFPSARTPNGDAPISDMALLAALRRMGFGKDEMSVHGFRAMARTVLDEVLGFRPDFIEHQLAHAVRDPNGRAYNRTAHLVERRKMMQAWADYLDGLKRGADVVPIKRVG